jgi:hypothetical protein
VFGVGLPLTAPGDSLPGVADAAGVLAELAVFVEAAVSDMVFSFSFAFTAS